MKKLFSLIILFGAHYCIKAQTITPSRDTIKPVATFDTLAARTDRTSVDPPEPVKTRFLTDYPGTSSVSWKVKRKYYIVTYTDPKTKMGHILVYDKTGKIMQRENEMSNYPSSIKSYYLKKYPSEKYFKVWETKSKNGQIFYYVFRDGKALWFDKDGNYVPSNNIRNSDLTSYSSDLK